MKAALYARVSTKEQKEEGSSLETQVEDCLKFASKNGYSVDGLVFKEDWTGATLDRPELDAVRNLVRNRDIDALIAYATDRLARNPIHLAILAEECDKHRVKLEFVTEPLDDSPEGQLILYVKGYAAQIERAKIADRTLRGKRMRARQGRIPAGGGIGLYGYDYVPGKEDSQGVRRVNEEQAKVVRMIFRWLVEDHMTLYGICVKLMEMGIASPKDTGRWGLSTVGRLLRNPAYMGKTYAFKYLSVEPRKPANTTRRYSKSARQVRPTEEWIEIPGATPPIISEEVFALAQSQLRSNLERSTRNQKHQYLLSGHIRCGLCGRRYIGHTNGFGYQLYRCYGRRRPESITPCPAKGVKGVESEFLVWEEVKKVLIHPDLILSELRRRQDEASNSQAVEDDIRVVDKRLERIDSSIQRLVTLYRLSEIDDQFILNENKKLKQEKERLLEEKAALRNRLEVQTVNEFQLEALREYCDRAAKNIEQFTYEDKRLALDALGIEVIVKPEGIAIRGAIPASIPSITSPPSLSLDFPILRYRSLEKGFALPSGTQGASFP